MDTNNYQKSTSSGTFIQKLALYYSEFLSTDFKKGNLPKRRFETKDRKGRISGVALEKYSTILPELYKKFENNFSKKSPLKVKHQKYRSSLAPVVKTAIETTIKEIEYGQLHETMAKRVDNFLQLLTKKNIDSEIEIERLKNFLEVDLESHVVAPLVEKLEPVFSRSAANVVDTLLTAQAVIVDLLLNDFDEGFPAAFYEFSYEKNEHAISNFAQEILSEAKIKSKLTDYFQDFSANDLFTELRNISRLEQLDDNLEYYLYFGELRFKNHNFPLFFMPLSLSFEADEFLIDFEPRIIINKKAVDYVTRDIQERSSSKSVSVVDNRIRYIDEDEKILDVLNALAQPIIRALEIDEVFSFSAEKRSIKNSNLSLTNSLNVALFDKSDESMLTDYEELIDRLSEDGENLIDVINNLVNGFLVENPVSIVSDIEDWWEETTVENRLVFETPIPLAEEQRKILQALGNSETRFVAVEGPPGTGKSHTISAIAFDAILNKKSILILSDTKEALDVVENKLNDTLGKVRPSDDFINPILRLGRTGSNFTKLTQNKTIDTLRVQSRAFKQSAGKEARDQKYKNVVDNLKSSISDKVRLSKDIELHDIISFETELKYFVEEWEDELELFIPIFENEDNEYTEQNEAIKLIATLREELLTLDQDLTKICKKFGFDPAAVAQSFKFCKAVADRLKYSDLFKKAPKIDPEKIQVIQEKIKEISASKGMFGYLFSGTKISAIKEDLYELIGLKTLASKGDALLNEVRNLLESAQSFYGDLTVEHYDFLELVPDVVAYSGSTNLIGLDDDWIKDLERLQDLYEDGVVPFLGDDTLVDILMNPNSGDGEFFREFYELQTRRGDIEEMFLLPETNYLARKTELENYHALQLAASIDERVIEFADQYRNDARTLSKIIRQKKKFPRDKFEILKTAFPCMICSLRDYAEYIPLEHELFDIIIIDEASQVSIAQAFPAIIRAKKMLIMGDKMQFGNVKTSNASKELNAAYFGTVKAALESEKGFLTTDLEVRADQLNVKHSVLDFMDNMTNFPTRLKKHFRGYPEMISLSSKYFYGGGLQAMKIRGKPIDEILQFVRIDHDGLIDPSKNTNEVEARSILEMVTAQYRSGDYRSVGVITPFTEQQTLISKIFSEDGLYDEFRTKLKFRSFTFDSCQGEERDIIYYSFVATNEKDRLSHVLPKYLDAQDEEELDRNKKMQRVNVAFSRGKEKLVFVHSKDIGALSAGSDILFHYQREIENAKELPDESQLDPNSPAEKKVLDWLQQTSVYLEYRPEIKPQFEIGKYLKFLDADYRHPAYRVDFLVRFVVNNKQVDIIIEYDGFEFHFNNLSEVDSGNWQHYQNEADIEREHILESYGYKTIRINRYNVGSDPIETLDQRIASVLEQNLSDGDALIKKVVDQTATIHAGLQAGTYRTCTKCREDKPYSDFEDATTKRGRRAYCKSCASTVPRRRQKQGSGSKPTHKKCPNCEQEFELEEFIDLSNKSGKRGICGACKRKSIAERNARYRSLRNRRW